jgi:glycerol-3-phosphate dehydrogenase
MNHEMFTILSILCFFAGAHDEEQGQVLHKLIQTEDFRVVVVKDVETVEMCGALKVSFPNGYLLIIQLIDF